MASDSVTDTVKAILVDTAAAAAIGIFAAGTVDTYMVLSKLTLEKYLENRFNDGKAKGAEQNDEMWRAWYTRMTEAKARGEEFSEPPARITNRKVLKPKVATWCSTSFCWSSISIIGLVFTQSSSARV